MLRTAGPQKDGGAQAQTIHRPLKNFAAQGKVYTEGSQVYARAGI